MVERLVVAGVADLLREAAPVVVRVAVGRADPLVGEAAAGVVVVAVMVVVAVVATVAWTVVASVMLASVMGAATSTSTSAAAAATAHGLRLCAPGHSV